MLGLFFAAALAAEVVPITHLPLVQQRAPSMKIYAATVQVDAVYEMFAERGMVGFEVRGMQVPSAERFGEMARSKKCVIWVGRPLKPALMQPSVGCNVGGPRLSDAELAAVLERGLLTTKRGRVRRGGKRLTLDELALLSGDPRVADNVTAKPGAAVARAVLTTIGVALAGASIFMISLGGEIFFPVLAATAFGPFALALSFAAVGGVVTVLAQRIETKKLVGGDIDAIVHRYNRRLEAQLRQNKPSRVRRKKK